MRPRDTLDFREDATAWFVTLEIARRGADHERAAEALRELRRLGVEVRFVAPRPSKPGTVETGGRR